MKNIPKYGFGMSPISENMLGRYLLATESILGLFEGEDFPKNMYAEALSELKGMFNRCIRQDQWDWYEVHTKFGKPAFSLMRKIVSEIPPLRKSILEDDVREMGLRMSHLESLEIRPILKNFLIGLTDDPKQNGWLYVLSTRESPNILKIGMTTRSVTSRVKEINSATGVLFPYSARAVFSVDEPELVEKEVFEILKEYRVRKDREFFDLDFNFASKSIAEYLRKRTKIAESGPRPRD